MSSNPDSGIPIRLENGSRIVVIGGGPAGAFLAIHLLRRAKAAQRTVKVTILERHLDGCQPGARCQPPGWIGCNYCAGGISPRLNDNLRELGLCVPETVIQNRIRNITIQGYWKNIELEVPEGRDMVSVFRGARPLQARDRPDSFDAFLLNEAIKEGAEPIAGKARDVARTAEGIPVVCYHLGETDAHLEADFLVFATGVNTSPGGQSDGLGMVSALQHLVPGYRPPRLRRALIFELHAESKLIAHLEGELHFVEYGSKALRLEMCSIVPKRGFLTVVLLGPSIDASSSPTQNQAIIQQFLELPHIRKLIPLCARLHVACVCNPYMVVGSATQPFGNRVAAIGDMATSRLYKDGILSAYLTAQALAETLFERGVDAQSLEQGYRPILERFQRDIRFARRVFFLHRMVFGSSTFSRIFYQAVIDERKSSFAPQRKFEKILWQIASGDDQYEDIFRAMMRPAAFWSILTNGLLLTMRNYLTEMFFGLNWEGFGRFTTGVARERFEAKRAFFGRLVTEFGIPIPKDLEFERMYTIRIHAPRVRILDQLGQYGEAHRGFFKPRWIRVHRVCGVPNEPGCVIRYDIGGLFSFSLLLERIEGEHLAVYRIQDGFARGGVLIFEIERNTAEISALSIYVAFNFHRGMRGVTRPLWWLLRWLFPAFMHDVIWNHSLCQFKGLVEAKDIGLETPPVQP